MEQAFGCRADLQGLSRVQGTRGRFARGAVITGPRPAAGLQRCSQRTKCVALIGLAPPYRHLKRSALDRRRDRLAAGANRKVADARCGAALLTHGRSLWSTPYT